MKSVIEYFQEMYGFTIQHTHLPCLQVGNQKKASYLPMEVNRKLLVCLFQDFTFQLLAIFADSISNVGMQNCRGTTVHEKVEWEADYCSLESYMPKAEGQRKRYFAGIFLVMYLIWFFVS